MEQLKLPSFAKVNWHLEILGRREDGLHEIRTLFETIDLHDWLYFRPGGEGIRFTVEGYPVPPGPENLVWQACENFERVAEQRVDCEIHLVKKIPPGAGLGGGSSNAAVTLLGLTRLYEVEWDRHLWSEVARSLGADVAFFLTGGAALGRGAGDLVEPWEGDRRKLDLILFWPGFEVSAGDAYRWYSSDRGATLLTDSPEDPRILRLWDAIERGQWESLRNDLEIPVFSRYPELRELRNDLLRAGADFVAMTGSGSALLAVGSPEAYGVIRRMVAEIDHLDGFFCRTVARGEYLAALS